MAKISDKHLTKPHMASSQDVLVKRIEEAKFESNPIGITSIKFRFMNKEFL